MHKTGDIIPSGKLPGVTEAKKFELSFRLSFAISRQAVLKEISKLINAEIVVLVGKGKSAY